MSETKFSEGKEGASNSKEEISPEIFREHCRAVGLKIAEKCGNAFVVMTDGSDQAEMALQATLNLRRKFDHVGLFHAYKDEPHQLSPAFRQENMKSKYEKELMEELPPGRYSLHWEYRRGRRVMDVLKQALYPGKEKGKGIEIEKPAAAAVEPLLPNGMEADFVVFGHHGRKGAKSAPTTLGSNAELALRSLMHPSIIIKTPCPRGAKTFIYAVNATEISKNGLDVLLKIVAPRDSLHVIMMCSPDDSLTSPKMEELKAYYESELFENGPGGDCDFAFLQRERGRNTAQALADYVNAAKPDFFALAPRVKQHLSAVSEYVTNHVNCSIVLLKN